MAGFGSKNLFFLITFVIGLLLSSCSNDPVSGNTGGSGTETVAGVFVDSTGSPVSKAGVYLFAQSDSERVASDTTDAKGKYRCNGLGSGVYGIRAYNSDTSLIYFGSFNYEDGSETLDLGVDTMYAPGRISGNVMVDSAYSAGVTVYIPGTSWIAITDSNGDFIISGIFPGEYRIRYEFDGYKSLVSDSIKVSPGMTSVADTVNLELSSLGNPPPPETLRAVYDTSSGVVKVEWSSVDVPDFSQYRIYGTEVEDDSSANREIGVTVDTSFTDTVYRGDTAALVSENYHSLRYQVRTEDTLNNLSAFSPQVSVQTVPPSYLKTHFSWDILSALSDTIVVGDTLDIEVGFSNRAYRIDTLKWYKQGNAEPIEVTTKDTSEGYDTLRHVVSDNDTGELRLYIRAFDESGGTSYDSCSVTVEGLYYSNTWTENTSLLQERRFCGATVSGGVLYTFGGMVDIYTGTGEWEQEVLSSLETMELSSGANTIEESFSDFRYMTELVSVSGNLYLSGGISSSSTLNRVEVYNTETQEIEEEISMPEPRFGHAVCASDSLIYITGGIILNSEGGHEITDRIDAIEVGTGEFHTLGRMNTPRVYHEACFLGDTLYMLGGQSSLYQPEVLRSVEVYSGDDQESAETSLMNTPRMQFGACAVKGRVYAFGGRTSLTGEGSVTKKTEVYTPESGEWVYKADMPEARYGFSVAAYQDDVYVVGGTDQTESPSGQSDKVFVFHP